MPSTPASTARRTELPWFLDALRWVRWLSPAGDRDTIELVRLDLGDDLRDLRVGGMARRKAYPALGRRVCLECGVFLPRAGLWWKARVKAALGKLRPAGRRIVKPVLGVGLIGVVLLGMQWLWLDRAKLVEWDVTASRLTELREELEDARSRLERAPDVDRGFDVPLSAEAESLIAKMEEIQGTFEQARRHHSGELFLSGIIGLIDEELALFWEARADEDRSSACWRDALSTYAQGVREGDPIALLQFGSWQLDRVGPRAAITYLRQAQERWHLLGTQREHDPGHAAADAKYHQALLRLWKAEREPAVAVQAHPLEVQAVRDLEHGLVREQTLDLIYNAACLRALMIEEGIRQPVDGIQAIEYLDLVLEAAGELRASFADGIATDSDLAGLRGLPAYAAIAAKADAIRNATRSQLEKKRD